MLHVFVSSTCTLFASGTGSPASLQVSSVVNDVLTNPAKLLKTTLQVSPLGVVTAKQSLACSKLECRISTSVTADADAMYTVTSVDTTCSIPGASCVLQGTSTTLSTTVFCNLWTCLSRCNTHIHDLVNLRHTAVFCSFNDGNRSLYHRPICQSTAFAESSGLWERASAFQPNVTNFVNEVRPWSLDRTLQHLHCGYMSPLLTWTVHSSVNELSPGQLLLHHN